MTEPSLSTRDGAEPLAPSFRATLHAPDAGDLLGKGDYVALRAQLDFAPKLLPNLAIIVFDALLGCAAVALLRMHSAPAYVLAQLLLPIVFFNAFAILHEAGHGSLSRATWLNSLLGHIASSLCFVPYFPWKYIHKQHHAWAGNLERDPVLKSLQRWRGPGVPGIVSASWKSWVPLGGLLQHVVYWMYPLVLRRQGELTPARAARCVLSWLWIPVSYLLLHALAPDVVRWTNVLPAIALFLVAEELVNLPHHVGAPTFTGKLAVWEQYLSTRSCYYPRGVSELLVLNFNFHIEHHLFPSLPWFRLRHARDGVKSLLGERYHEAVGLQWNREQRARDLQDIVAETPVRARCS
jgi:fatty acid desaturase